MLTFIHKGVFYNGPACVTLSQKSNPKGHEIWLKKWAGKSGAGGVGDRKHSKMRRGRRRTLAVMARSLFASAKARRGRVPTPAPKTTVEQLIA